MRPPQEDLCAWVCAGRERDGRWEARVRRRKDKVHAKVRLLGSRVYRARGCDREAAGRASCPQRKLFDPRRVDAPVFVTVCKYRPLKLTFTWGGLDRVREGAAARRLPQSTCGRPLGRTHVTEEQRASAGRPTDGGVGAPYTPSAFRITILAHSPHQSLPRSPATPTPPSLTPL